MSICPLSDRALVNKCVEFVQEFAGRKFYDFQKLICYRIVESLINRDGAVVSALVSRQAGKTEIVSKTISALVILLPKLSGSFPDDQRLIKYARGLNVLIFGPVEEKALLPFNRARELINSAHGQKILDSLKVYTTANKKGDLVFSNGSSIIARSASAGTNNEGNSGHLIILEETQDISRTKIEKEIRPILANTFGTMVAIGTANEVGATFKEMIESNIRIEEETGVQNHFEFDWIKVVANKKEMYEREAKLHKEGKGPAPNVGHLEYEKHVLGEIKRYGGQDVSEFRMNFLLKWREGGAGAIDRKAWKAGAVRNLEFGQRRWRGIQVAGIDVGKVNDSTCVVVADLDWEHPIIDHFAQGSDKEAATLYRKCITDVAFFKGLFENDGLKAGQYQMICDFLARKQVGVVCVDCTSVGDPVYERIKALLGDFVEVLPVRFTHSEKTNLYKHYTQEVEAGRVSYAAGPLTSSMETFKDFDDQHFELLKVSNVEKQTVSYEAPAGLHDDAPDAAALMCRAATLVKAQLMPYIEVQEMPSRFTFRATEGPAKGRRVVSQDSPLYRGRRKLWPIPRRASPRVTSAPPARVPRTRSFSRSRSRFDSPSQSTRTARSPTFRTTRAPCRRSCSRTAPLART